MIETVQSNEVRAKPQAAAVRLALPSQVLLVAVIVCTLVMIGVWSLIAALSTWSGESFIAGLVGAGAVGVVAILGVLIMRPWKQREVAEWMTMWLAATVFRLFGTPILVYLLYSAAPEAMAAKPLALAVASTYFVTLLAEAAILASHMKRSFPPA